MSRARYAQLLERAPADAEAIEFEGAWTTWGTLRAVSQTLDGALRRRGIPEGGRVGMVLESRPEHVGAAMAVIATGRCLVTFSPLQPPARLAEDIAAAGVPVLVASPAVLAHPAVAGALGAVGAIRLTATAADEDVRPRPIEAETVPGVTVEMLTSGTTGRPKRICITDRQFDAALASSVPLPRHEELFRSGVSVVTTPLVHIGGFWGALGPLYAGRRIVLIPKFGLEPWVEAIRRHRPKAVGMVPATLRVILEADVPAADLSSLQVITSGTAHCPDDVVDGLFERYGIRVLSYYGATEFAGAVAGWTAAQHRDWWERKRGSAGRALPGAGLRVVTPRGAEVSPGAEGLLEVRTPQSVVGGSAWVRTSDLASIDDEGFLWIRGRADDMITRGGFKIDPSKVRAVLEEHSSVREAAVAPLPDRRLGQVPVAAAEMAPGKTVEVAELEAHCRERLLPYEVPKHIAVVAELPRAPSSKVSRIDLLEMILDAVS